MTIIPILIVLAVTAAASTYFARQKEDFGRNSRGLQHSVATPVAWVSGALLIIGGVLYPISYATSVSSNAALEAYSATVHSAYHETAMLTEQIHAGTTAAVTLPVGTVVLDAAAWEQNKATAERWTELRNKVEWYNTLLASKIAWNENWFLRLWIAAPPALAPITFPTT